MNSCSQDISTTPIIRSEKQFQHVQTTEQENESKTTENPTSTRSKFLRSKNHKLWRLHTPSLVKQKKATDQKRRPLQQKKV